MFYRIEMDIVKMHGKVGVIPNGMLPITPLPHRRFSFFFAGIDFVLLQFHRPPGNAWKISLWLTAIVRDNHHHLPANSKCSCKWSGSRQIASTLNGCFRWISFQTRRRMSRASSDVRNSCRPNVTRVKNNTHLVVLPEHNSTCVCWIYFDIVLGSGRRPQPCILTIVIFII